MASLRNKPKAAPPEKIEPAAQPLSEADQDTLDTATPQPELAATAELLRSQIADLRRAEDRAQDRHGEPDAVVTSDDRRREWIESNPLAQQYAAELNTLHREALGAGLIDTSPSYFEFMDARLSKLAAQTPAAAAGEIVKDMEQRSAQNTAREQRQQEAAPNASRYVSAPVSREIASMSGRRGSINLTPQQRESARISGISESEYARQLLRFEELKASGDYGYGRDR